MRSIEQFTACRVLPDFEKGVADDDSPRRQLAQQLCHGLGSLTVSRDNYGPFQVLPKVAGDDAPLIERARRSRSDLNERPVSNQRKRDFAVRGREGKLLKRAVPVGVLAFVTIIWQVLE